MALDATVDPIEISYSMLILLFVILSYSFKRSNRLCTISESRLALA